jgi:hypothetical protein
MLIADLAEFVEDCLIPRIVPALALKTITPRIKTREAPTPIKTTNRRFMCED